MEGYSWGKCRLSQVPKVPLSRTCPGQWVFTEGKGLQEARCV